MSIFDSIFGKQPEPTPAPAPAATPTAAPASAAPTEPAAQPQEDLGPLDKFKGLWDTDQTGEQQQQQAPQELTMEALQTSLKDVNFASNITPDTLAAITAGGEDAVTAFATALNSVAKQSMAQSILIANKLANTNLDRARQEVAETLPQQIRTQNIQNSQTPILQNPAIKPVAEAVMSQLAVKFPNATPAEINSMTVDYINATYSALNPKDPTADQVPASEDWDKFLQI